MELIPFSCPEHGWQLDTLPTADVWCHCRRVCRPADEDAQKARKRALDTRRKGRARESGQANALTSTSAKPQPPISPSDELPALPVRTAA